MYCYYCGKENSDEQKFCKYCGKNLKLDNGQQEKPDNIQYKDKPEKVSKLLVTIVILLSLVLLALGACLLIYIRSGEKNFLAQSGKVQEETYKENGDDKGISDAKDSVEDAAADTEPAYDETITKAESVPDESSTDENKSSEETVTDRVETDDNIEVENTSDDFNENESLSNQAEEKQEEKAADKKLSIVFAEASSALNVTSKDHATYVAGNVCDGNYKTAWVEGVDGNGEGQSIVLHLDGIHKISCLKIYNGYLKTKRRYAINGRIETALVDYGNGHQQKVNLNLLNLPEEEVDFAPDEMGETVIDPGFDCETDTITITIMSVVQGSKYTDTAISEIEVFEE